MSGIVRIVVFSESTYQKNFCFISSNISTSSFSVLALSIRIRIERKSGMPLNIGVAARCLRVCSIALYSSPM